MVNEAAAQTSVPESRPNPFARFEEGLQIPLEAVVADAACAPLRSFFESAGAYVVDPWAARDWSFAGPLVLDRAFSPDACIASSDPHILELGATGRLAVHRTPAPLLSRARTRFHSMQPPRLVRVHVPEALPDVLDPVDVAFAVALETTPFALGGSIVEYDGPGIEALTMSERRRLCAASWVTGCEAAGARDRSSQEKYHQLIVIDPGDRQPLAYDQASHRIVPVADLDGQRVANVLFGGCVAGDAESIRWLANHVEAYGADAQANAVVVAGSSKLQAVLTKQGVARRLAMARIRLRAPGEMEVAEGTTLSTTTCLAPGAIMVSPKVAAGAMLEAQMVRRGTSP